MSLTIKTTPKASIEVGVNKVIPYNYQKSSKWNAVYNPIRFSLIRKDFDIKNINFDVNINAIYPYVSVDIPLSMESYFTSIVAGDSVYIFNSKYRGIFTVNSIQYVSGVYYYIILETANIGNSSGGYINLNDSFNNYYCETKIYDDDDVLIGTALNKPDSEGLITIDIAAWLKTLINCNNEFLYNQINKKDVNLFGKYYINYTEKWQGGTGSSYTAKDYYYFVNAALQLQSDNNGNMAQYCPFNISVLEVNKAKFLSDFEEPTYFPDYPFDINFIWSNNLSNKSLVKREETFDINNVSKGITDDGLLILEKEGVNRLMLKQGYSDISYLDVWLETDYLITIKYVINDYIAKGFVITIIDDCGFYFITKQLSLVAEVLKLKGATGKVIGINWGDSNYLEHTLNGSLQSINKTYSNIGEYIIAFYNEINELSQIKADSFQLIKVVLDSTLIDIDTLSFKDNELYHIIIPETYTKLIDLDLSGNKLCQSAVDGVLVSLMNIATPSGTVDLSGGTNEIPTVTGIMAKTFLESIGWTITINT
jgi:hypothetical protein